MEVIIYTALVLAGLCLGSYAGATVWRLRVRSDDKQEAGDNILRAAREKLRRRRGKEDRSICLHCGHRLAWYDMVPLVSWLSLGGKCRYCRRPIGYMEPLIELSVAAFFVLSYAFWPHATVTAADWVIFGLWLAAGVGLAIIFVYDAKWFLVPYQAVFAVAAIGLISAALTLTQAAEPLAQLASIGGALLILAGLYYVLYVVSHHQWVGFGDVQIGVGLALLLADWRLAILTLFLANLIGVLVVLPGLVSGKLGRTSRVPFGPLLITGFVIAGLFGEVIINWYMSALAF